MKTMRLLLIAASLTIGAMITNVCAQEQPAQKHEFKLQKGDSVMIKRECERYLTGERPSTWVWDKVLVVRQLGTKRFPDGVLLMPILSWMCEDCVVNVNGRAAEAKEAAEDLHEAEKAAEQAAEEARRDSIDAARAAARQARLDSIAAAEAIRDSIAAEQARQDSIAAAERAAERARLDSIAYAQALEQARLDSIAEAEKAKGDSIRSQQKFKHTYDRFTIGVRGGASSLLHHADKAKWTCGGDVILDLQYAHYWANDTRPVDLGLLVGIGIGYEQSGLSSAYDSTAFTKQNVNYTVVTRDVKETDHQLQLEIPIMFSLITQKGFFFNVGPKLMLPVYTPYKQTVNADGTHITAYFPETGVTIQDNPVTGRYEGQQPEADNGIQFKINIMLGAELGYEWVLRSGNSFGLGVYANYSVFNSYKNTVSTEGLFQLTAPTDEAKASLEVLSATHTYADKLGYFDAGIKLAYHLNFPKKRQNIDSKLF